MSLKSYVQSRSERLKKTVTIDIENDLQRRKDQFDARTYTLKYVEDPEEEKKDDDEIFQSMVPLVPET